MEVALEGVRILDLSQYLSAPFGAMLLADLGAEVIKVEAIDLGPEVRKMIPLSEPDPHGAGFLAVNRNKKSLALDLRQPKGKEVFYDLVRASDVVVDNLRPGATARLGVDYDTLAEINPRIICCSLTAFGSTGPLATHPAFDLVLQAITGAMAVDEDWRSAPKQMAVSVADTAGGVYLAISVLSALYRRDRTGRGERVETSMLASLMSMMTFDSAGASILGLEPRTLVAPYGTFKTRDGWIAIAAHRRFEVLCRVLGIEATANDARFDTIAKRAEHKHALNAIVEEALRQRSTDEWIEQLAAADVPCSRVNSVKDALAHPQVSAEDLLVSFDYVLGGRITTIGNAVKLRSTPPEKRKEYSSPPKLGQHSEDVLRDILGYSTGQVEDLREQRVIRCG